MAFSGFPTGHSVIVHKGIKQLGFFIMEQVIVCAASGMWYDSGHDAIMEWETQDDEPLDLAVVKAADKNRWYSGPYYRQLEYMPTIVKRFGMEQGLQVVMETAWSASMQAISAFCWGIWKQVVKEVWGLGRYPEYND